MKYVLGKDVKVSINGVDITEGAVDIKIDPEIIRAKSTIVSVQPLDLKPSPIDPEKP